MVEPTTVITAINGITAGIKIVSPIIGQAQKDEVVINILKSLKLDPTQIPDDVDAVYAYSLVEYGAFKPEAILNLFRNKKIKDYFWEAYTNNKPLEFVNRTKDFINKNNDLNNKITHSGINLLAELEEFGEVFITVAKKTTSPRFKPYPDWNLDAYPKRFKALIYEKTRIFCGRQFVFEKIRNFLATHPQGYFTVIGDPGMGKSAIAAKYILAYKYPCFFNIFVEGENTPEKFLTSIREQLIRRYSLDHSDNADLPTLLQKASEKLQSGQKLVIVIDALDEVQQEGNANLLNLPQNLPNGVYFLLTRRPYDLKNKRLLSPDTPKFELDLRQFQTLSEEDIKEYITLNLQNQPKLKEWINNRNISDNDFCNQLASKSENNFMYLRYILPAIIAGEYADLQLTNLPQGLQEYYQQHWQRMGMDEETNETKVKILYVLVERNTSISSRMIANILDQEELEINSVLKEWIEYITKRRNEDENRDYYSIYHRSFQEFLKKQDELNPNRKLFDEVKTKMADYMRDLLK